MAVNKSKRNSSNASATKWFVTAASIAAMLGGWVALSSQPSLEVDTAAIILENDLGLEPVPTLVPAPVQAAESRQDVSVLNDSSSTVQTKSPALRSVTAPRPAPVTVTSSSR